MKDLASSDVEAIFSQIADDFRELAKHGADVRKAADMMTSTLRAGGKVIFCGNGGSAADAQHLAAELMGRFLVDRAPLAALALTVDTSALTAIGNDYGYEHVFSRQLHGIGKPGDVLIGISTSGNSRNVIEAFNKARELGIHTIALTGQSGGQLRQLSDLCIAVPASRTDHIQQLHIAVGHAMCGIVEEVMA